MQKTQRVFRVNKLYIYIYREREGERPHLKIGTANRDQQTGDPVMYQKTPSHTSASNNSVGLSIGLSRKRLRETVQRQKHAFFVLGNTLVFSTGVLDQTVKIQPNRDSAGHSKWKQSCQESCQPSPCSTESSGSSS